MRVVHTAPAVLLALALVVPGVVRSATPDGSSPTSQPAAKARAAEMLRHDELAEKERAAVVAGDLEAFRLGMEITAVQPLPGSDPERASELIARARAGRDVGDIQAAAVALGKVGAACAGCHAVHPQARFAASGFEEGSADVIDRMQRHWWAVEAMWQGLVEPNEVAWQMGAKTLAAADLTKVPGFPDDPAATARASALRIAASEAASAKTVEARGVAFGKVLGTCADCHQALKRGPMPQGDAP